MSEKELATKMLMETRQAKSSKSPRLSFYVILCSATRTCHSQMLFKIGLLKHLAKLTGKHLCQSLLFNKVAALKPATLFKK